MLGAPATDVGGNVWCAGISPGIPLGVTGDDEADLTFGPADGREDLTRGSFGGG